MIDKIKTFLNHERYQAVSIFVVCSLLLWLFSCESKVRSIQSPGTFVTRDELSAEVDFYLAQAEIRLKNLNRQDELKELVLNNALLFAKGGTINPYGLLATIAGVLGIGATVDNVRKRKVIRTELSRVIEDAHKT